MKAPITVLACVSMLLCAAASAHAQPSPTASAIYHGDLVLRPARGVRKPKSSDAMVRIRKWPFRLALGSNGLFPDQEPIKIELAEDPGFYLDAGMLRPIRKGRSFVYRARRATAEPRSILSFRLDTQPDGTYLVSFKIRGADLSRLTTETPICEPFAVIIGDDDGFLGAVFSTPRFNSPRLTIPSDCDLGDDAWPWIDG